MRRVAGFALKLPRTESPMLGVPYHFLIVHFPIVLILSALFFDLRGVYQVGYRLTLGAAASAGLAVATGLMLSGGRLSELTVHAGAGITAGLVSIVLAVLRYSAQGREEDSHFPPAWLALELITGMGILIAA